MWNRESQEPYAENAYWVYGILHRRQDPRWPLGGRDWRDNPITQINPYGYMRSHAPLLRVGRTPTRWLGVLSLSCVGGSGNELPDPPLCACRCGGGACWWWRLVGVVVGCAGLWRRVAALPCWWLGVRNMRIGCAHPDSLLTYPLLTYPGESDPIRADRNAECLRYCLINARLVFLDDYPRIMN